MRTTLDIDPTVLEGLKRRARKESKTVGELVSELAAKALAEEEKRPKPEFWWPVQRMGPRIDLEDKEALWALLDAEQFGGLAKDEP